MTVEQTRAAAQELLDGTTGDLAGAGAERFQALNRRAEQLREQEQQRVTAARDLVHGLAAGEIRTEASSVQPIADGDEARPRAVRQRDDALRTLDRAVRGERLAARGAELVEGLMRSGPVLSQTWMQRWAVAAGSEASERAFAKKLTDPDNGQLLWTGEEADAWRAVAAVQIEQRAMSLTDNAGGYMVPLTLDPAIMLTSNGSTNPLRAISRVVQTATDAWQGVTSAGVTSEWTAEAAEVADASPTLGQPSIPVYKGDAFVPFSFEVQGDALNFTQELGKLLQDGADQLTATAYTTGSGSGQPTSPRRCIPSRDASITRHQQGFTPFARPAFPSPVTPRRSGRPLGFPPSFTPQTPGARAHVRAGTGLRH